ncbi:4975_t:CDS:2 [Gigaspora margarita]|uniref:4975_t:CDS:1 n=1 Tax=Gigaspora margarita TaxID=4874 RepID=A0ABN7VE87_GIGMA|nr:4975_t:CDS:2 [Gigaspora margarita]
MSRILFQVMIPSGQLLPALESRFAPTRHLSPALGSRINTQNDFTSFYQYSINPMITLRKSSASELNYSNNTFNHFNSNNIVILSIFNKMSIYQICLWLYANPNILQLADTKGIEWLQVAKRHFGDFCNKLINNNAELVKDFKKKSTYSTTSPLQKEEIIAFVDKSATINTLNQ